MIVIIDSGGANITSVISAFDRMDVKTTFTSDIETIRSADKILLPGVGAAGDAMKTLKGHGLADIIPKLEQPVLGICLGMQLLFQSSEENDTTTLGAIPGRLKLFEAAKDMTVPHMGWNNIKKAKDHPLLHGLDDDSYFYFVHSFYAPVGGHTIGACNYGADFTAIAAKGNFMGCQFHPERSGPAGAKILKNFAGMPC